jgi:hypothetical protein
MTFLSQRMPQLTSATGTGQSSLTVLAHAWNQRDTHCRDTSSRLSAELSHDLLQLSRVQPPSVCSRVGCGPGKAIVRRATQTGHS